MSNTGVRWDWGERSRTNLIVHHSITDVLRQTTEPIHIVGTIQESCDLPTFCQRDEVSKNNIQFPTIPVF